MGEQFCLFFPCCSLSSTNLFDEHTPFSSTSPLHQTVVELSQVSCFRHCHCHCLLCHRVRKAFPRRYPMSHPRRLRRRLGRNRRRHRFQRLHLFWSLRWREILRQFLKRLRLWVADIRRVRGCGRMLQWAVRHRI